MGKFVHRWLLPIASGGLMAAAFPPFNSWQCAWVCLLPLLFALVGCSRREAFLRGWITGLVFFGATTWWIIHVTLPGVVLLVAALALYFGAFSLVVETPTASTTAGNVRWMMINAAVWVALEWVRGWFIFGGFGWNGLGVSQHRILPLIQFTEFTGVYGVSALVCLFNLALFITVRRFVRGVRERTTGFRLSWEMYGAVLLVCAAMVYGVRVLMVQPAVAKTMRLVLVQANIPQTLKWDASEKQMILERYRSLTETAMAAQPDLIIWPETATPDAVRFDRESYALATNMAARAGVPVLTGSFDYTTNEAFNAAVLVEPNGVIEQVYRKMHLVPFGEYVPLRKIFPFLKWLTPIDGSFERGREATAFDWRRTRFGVVICFEDTVAAVYRQFVKREAAFMVNLTNDAWFQDSPQSEIHLANAVFRAAETRRPLVRCTNNGVTCVVDAHGMVQTRLPTFTEGVLRYELDIPPVLQQTFYTEHGDVFAWACAAITGVAILRKMVRRS